MFIISAFQMCDPRRTKFIDEDVIHHRMELCCLNLSNHNRTGRCGCSDQSTTVFSKISGPFLSIRPDCHHFYAYILAWLMHSAALYYHWDSVTSKSLWQHLQTFYKCLHPISFNYLFWLFKYKDTSIACLEYFSVLHISSLNSLLMCFDINIWGLGYIVIHSERNDSATSLWINSYNLQFVSFHSNTLISWNFLWIQNTSECLISCET